MKPIIFETKNKNKYLYSPNQKDLLCIDNKTFDKITDFLDTKNFRNESCDKSYFGFLLNNEFLHETRELKPEPIKDEDILYNIANISQLVFEVTEDCNLECKYCGFGDYYLKEKRDKASLSVDKAFKAIDYLFNAKKTNAFESYNSEFRIGFYGGEPLLNFNFINIIVDYSKKRCPSNINLSFGMTTNGTLLEKHIDYLISNNFSVMISLDGDEDSSSYRIFKNGLNSFKTVYNQIQNIKENHSDFFINNIRFNSVLHDRNNVKDLYSFFSNNFGKLPQISELHTGNIDESMQSNFLEKYKSATDDISKLHSKTIEEELFIKSPRVKGLTDILFNYSKNVKKDYYQLFYQQEDKFHLTGTCTPFSRKFFVSARGLILPCEKIHHKYAMGFISNEVNLNVTEIVENFNNTISNISSQCENCGIKEHCQQCVFSLPLRDGNMVCNQSHNQKSLKQSFINRIEFLEENPQFYDKIMNEIVIR